MAKIIRLNTIFTLPNLPQLKPFTALEREIISKSSLKGFWDFSSRDFLELDGSNNITRAFDRSVNGKDAVQITADNAPVFNDGIFPPRVSGATFDGTKTMVVENGFPDSDQMTVVFAGSREGFGGSRIFVSSETNREANFYVNGLNGFMSWAGDVRTNIPLPVGEVISSISTININSKLGHIYSGNVDATGGLDPVKSLAGNLHIGAWHGEGDAYNWLGNVAYIMVFNEDVSKNAELLSLLQSYATARFV